MRPEGRQEEGKKKQRRTWISGHLGPQQTTPAYKSDREDRNSWILLYAVSLSVAVG